MLLLMLLDLCLQLDDFLLKESLGLIVLVLFTIVEFFILVGFGLETGF